MFPAISRQILKVCKEDFSRAEILAVALYGSRAGGYARIDSDYDILLVINNYLSEIRYHNHIFGETYLSILAVDRDLLEFDAEAGGFGDFVSGRLTSPYIPLQNEEYLKKIELIVKRRFIEEDLLDLILEYGTLAKQLIIKPEYLALARMRKRSRLYPPLRYSYYNMLRKDLRNKNLNNILEGYNDVLKNLEDEGSVKKVDENILLTKKQTTLTPKGEMNCIHGDARELSKYIMASDIIITSPPYSGTDLDSKDPTQRAKRLTMAGYDPKKYFGGRARNTTLKPYDIDAIISSPPYGNRLSDVAIHDDDSARMGYKQTVDVVLTSPPYEKSIPAQDEKWLEEHWNDESKSPKHKTMRFGKSMKGYIANSENIGTLKGETYLEAMLQVYQECFKVLKPLGTMILVTKNFIRDKDVIRLDLDTIKLCESIGFKLIDHWYFELPTKSFWKILYHKKYPKVPEVRFEDILIFQKIVVPPKR